MSAIAEQNPEFINITQNVPWHMGQIALDQRVVISPAKTVSEEYHGVITDVADFAKTTLRGVAGWLQQRRRSLPANPELAWDIDYFDDDSD